MMSTTDFSRERKLFSADKFPHKVVSLADIAHIGENLFKIENTDVECSTGALHAMDEILNINSKQIDAVKGGVGEVGASHFRNYVTAATNLNKDTQVVVIADSKERKVVDIVPIVEEYISPNHFFDFAEMFLNTSNYKLNRVEHGYNISDGLRLFLDPIDPHITKLATEEEFITNGLALEWTPVEVKISEYYTRLACLNGAIATTFNKRELVHSLNAENMIALMEAGRAKLRSNNFHLYAQKAKQAVASRASMRELRFANQLLLNNSVDSQIAENVIGYDREVSRFSVHNIDVTKYQATAKSSYSLWEIYNQLTQFATHTDLWTPSDIRRGRVMLGADKLLNKKPDIQNYIEMPIMASN